MCAFIFLVFAIIGVETFKGMMHYRCALPGFIEQVGHSVPDSLQQENMLHLRGLLNVFGPSLGDEPGLVSSAATLARLPHAVAARSLKGGGGSSSGITDAESEWDTGVACNPAAQVDACAADVGGPGGRCAYFSANPSNGLMSFDHVGVTFVTLLQTITFDDWTEAMYNLMTAYSPYAFLYFVAIVVLGGFFVVNLFLAVICQSFQESHYEQRTRATSREPRYAIGEP